MFASVVCIPIPPRERKAGKQGCAFRLGMEGRVGLSYSQYRSLGIEPRTPPSIQWYHSVELQTKFNHVYPRAQILSLSSLNPTHRWPVCLSSCFRSCGCSEVCRCCTHSDAFTGGTMASSCPPLPRPPSTAGRACVLLHETNSVTPQMTRLPAILILAPLLPEPQNQPIVD